VAVGADQRGQAFFGLVLIDPVKCPRGLPRTIGRLVTELDLLLREHSGDEAANLRHWL
jgi:hypothetical protein